MYELNSVAVEVRDVGGVVARREVGAIRRFAVVDAAGFLDSVRQIIKRNGELIEVGWPARDIPNTEMRSLFFHGVKIIPSRVRVPETWRRSIALAASGAVDLKPMVTHRYDLDHGVEAFELLHNKQGVKALIMPRPE